MVFSPNTRWLDHRKHWFDKSFFIVWLFDIFGKKTKIQLKLVTLQRRPFNLLAKTSLTIASKGSNFSFCVAK